MILYFILGGSTTGGSEGIYTRSSEYYNTTSKAFEMGPDLPHLYGITQHCLAWKDDDVIMLVAGMIQEDAANTRKDTTNRVYEFNTRDESFTEITPMNIARESTGCLVVDTAIRGKELIVASGKLQMRGS